LFFFLLMFLSSLSISRFKFAREWRGNSNCWSLNWRCGMWWYWLGLVGGRIIRMWLGLIVWIIFEKKRWSFIVDTICKWTFIFNLIMLNKVFFIFNISLICFVGHSCTITNLASLPSIVCYQTISCLWAASILSRRSSLCYITSGWFLSIWLVSWHS